MTEVNAMDARVGRGVKALVVLGLLLVVAAAVGCGPGAEQATGTVRGTVVRPPGRDPRSGGAGSDGRGTARVPVNGDPVRARDAHDRVVANTVGAPPDGRFRFDQPRTRRLTPNGSGGLTVGGAVNISTSTDAAMPSVAVLDNGTVTAQYSGDGNYLAGDPASLTQSVACTRTITGDYPRDVFADRESTCIIDAHVGGTVHGIAQGALFIGGSTVDGSVLSTRGTLFAICDSTIDGTVSVARATGFVLLGDPDDDGCAPNHVTGGVQLPDNGSGAELVSHRIDGSVQVNGTTGSGPFPIDDRAAIVGNTIGGSLSCARNVPPPTNRGVLNDVTGSRRGQCAAL
ncbi:hypothetical protein [Streptomyces vietnamensis]|uniref:hypothetical protein n=1 Tax=Streptomyces vietnamensis TaxID=362257 RepID=UPI0034178FB8